MEGASDEQQPHEHLQARLSAKDRSEPRCALNPRV